MKGLNSMLLYAEGKYENKNLKNMVIKQLVFTDRNKTERIQLEGLDCECLAKYGLFICRWKDTRLNHEKMNRENMNRLAAFMARKDIKIATVIGDCNTETEITFDEISLFNNHEKYSFSLRPVQVITMTT